MPDLERRSSASFISSKEGGTPCSFRRSWMKRNNSCCFFVSMGVPGAASANQQANRQTKHEQCYMFALCSATVNLWLKRSISRSAEVDDLDRIAGAGGRRVRRSDRQAVGGGEHADHGRILDHERCHHRQVRARVKT